MKSYMKSALFIVFLLSTLIACKDKEPAPLLPDDYENGVFISNEGNFGSGNGSLSYYDLESEQVFNQVFSLENDGDLLGDVVQSMHGVNNQLYIVVNNSNKVEVMSLLDLASIQTITGLSLPRYMTSQNGMGYVSEWVSFTDPGRVAVIDLSTGDIQKTIETDFGAEGLIISNGKLFVSNNFTTTVSIIDLATEMVTNTIDVGNSPGLFVEDNEGDLWLICSGGYDLDYNQLNDGQFIEIDPIKEEVIKTIGLGRNTAGKIAINTAGDQLYFIVANQLFKLSINDTEVPDEAFITEDGAARFYGIGVSEDDVLYLSDDKGFSEIGTIFRYQPDGSFIDKFTAAIGPNGFLFN